METFLIKLAVAVIPLIILVVTGTLWDVHARKRRVLARRAHWVHKSALKGFAAGILFR